MGREDITEVDGTTLELLEAEDLEVRTLFDKLAATQGPSVEERAAHGDLSKQLVRHVATREAALTDVVGREPDQVALVRAGAGDLPVDHRVRPPSPRLSQGLPKGAPLAASTLPEHPERGVMPPAAWSKKRERQYEHIKEGLEDRGDSERLAEEIASRTVNKERARAGEARQSSSTSTKDISSGRRGGLRSHRGSGGRTRDQLYEEARRRNIEGRSKMSKAQLEHALDR